MNASSQIACFVASLTIAGCSSDPGETTKQTDAGAVEEVDASPTDPDGGSSLPLFRDCTGRDFVPTFTSDWDNFTSAAIAVLTPGHSIDELILSTLPPSSGQVQGTFVYGATVVDIEDESITAFIDDCGGNWAPLGLTRTDVDGRAVFDLPNSIFEQPGRYEVAMVVQGDGTIARGDVVVVPPETNFAVFDIDGTLTTGDSDLSIQFFVDIFGGDSPPEMRVDANLAVQDYADAGYEIIYLTGRPYWLDRLTRSWLKDNSFPRGTLHLTTLLGEALPTEGGVGAFKRDYLQRLVFDHKVRRAYGNASTDIYGYQQASIPNEDIYITGPNGGAMGTQVLSTYTNHRSTVTVEPAVQPFRR